MKECEFLGDSKKIITSFPNGAKAEMLHQIEKLLHGLEPSDWKVVHGVGAGVKEIRIRNDKNQYRAVYVAHRGNTVYILHAFKKSKSDMSSRDFKTIQLRYKEIPKR